MMCARSFLVVDDHEIVRRGVRTLFENAFPGSQVLEAEDTDHAYRVYQCQPVDAVVLDLNLPGSGGLDLISRVCLRDENARIVVLSMHSQASYARRALRAGARGYVTKAVAATELIKAVKSVLAGSIYIDSSTAMDVARAALYNEESQLERLSPREFAVFHALAKGNTPRDIARQLNLSVNTVGNYRRTILRKLELRTLTELVRLALLHGVIGEGDQ